jgi:uroporphyrinogen-III synthase
VTGSLAGFAVVVTRPARQAANFVQLLRAQEAAVVELPALAIEPVILDPAARQALAPDAFDWVVYTSANAVEQSLVQLGRPTTARVGSIGRGTARALADAGIQVHAIPASGADSEGLLAHPAFVGARGRRVLIVKGLGGRDALRAGLAARGALVSTVDVYRRVRPSPSPQALDDLCQAPESGTVVATVTSVEVLESLLAMAPQQRCPWLRDAPLIAPGKRVATEARRLGWRGPLVVASSAEDEAMLAALASWVAGSGDVAPA